MNKIWRGDLYLANLNPSEGSEQGGIRPVVIVSNNAGNSSSTVMTVVPITSREKKDLPTHVELTEVSGLPKQSVALCEQIRTLDHKRMISYLGHLNAADMNAINRAINHELSLSSCPNESDIISLCPACRDSFYNSNLFIIRRADRYQVRKEICTFCNHHMGLDYYVFKRSRAERKGRTINEI